MKKSLYIKRSQRIRSKLKNVNKERFRRSIYKSTRNISAQIIDDKNNKTLVSASSLKDNQLTRIKRKIYQFLLLVY